jgi:hypothetical protein
MARSRPRDDAIYNAALIRETAKGNSVAYAKRIASAEARGIPRQQARGHVEREHVVRAERARTAGKLTSAEKEWLKRQQARVGFDVASEAGKLRFEGAVKAFTAMTPAERDAVRAEQRQRQKSPSYASFYPPGYGYILSPLYLSSRSGLR